MWVLGPRMVECGQSASDVPNLRGDIAKAWSLKTGLKVRGARDPERENGGKLWVAEADGGLGGVR